LKGLVYKSTGSWYNVKSENDKLIKCKIKGKLRLENINSTNPIAVGDFVEYEIQIDDSKEIGIINKVYERQNYILRKSVNLSKQTHILAANIDILLLVVTLKNPITTTGFIDRFLVSAEAYSIQTILVFNKYDLYDNDDKKKLNSIIEIYKKVGYKCFITSSVSDYGINELKKNIIGRKIMFGGHSGVGKSSLINKFDCNLNLKVGTISSQHSQGKHTTTYAEIFDLDNKTKLIDTPGIKGFGLTKLKKEEIGNFFPEFLKYKSKCKFNNCLHLNEPKCVIKEKVKELKIGESRYQNYVNMINNEDLKYR
tara:strand:+ start:1307 stop:2236 length:930 start_codon:yes stop_codon:yes gene_type:complete